MQVSLRTRRAFTLIEIVVVLAIVGIALSIAGPSLMRPIAADSLQSVIDRTRNLALRRAEPVTLVVGADGKWTSYAVRTETRPVGSGRLGENPGISLRLDISPLGLCSSDDILGSGAQGSLALDPFACIVTRSTGVSR